MFAYAENYVWITTQQTEYGSTCSPMLFTYAENSVWITAQQVEYGTW